MTDVSPADDAVRILVDAFVAMHPIETAAEIDRASPEGAVALLETQPSASLAGLLRRVRPEQLGRILSTAPDDLARSCLLELDPARSAAALAWLDEGPRDALLVALPNGLAREIRQIASFPHGTAGQMMDGRVALFAPSDTAGDALDRLRELRHLRISDLVIADADGRFEGVVRLQDLATAEPSARLASLMSHDSTTVDPLAQQDEVVDLLNEHRLASLPVVDPHGMVVGIVRYGALVDAAQREAVGNLQQMVGGSAEESALSPPWIGIKSRLPWLNINLVTAFMAAAVVGLFEDTISRFTALAVLLPVVAGQSGNTGAQALAVTMRGLALREIRVSHALSVLRKELAVGFANGIAIAVVTSGGVFIWSRSLGLALVMFLAMIASMVAASASGGLIPILLVRLGRDPAVASSILLTTVTDIAGFFSFLGLATLLAPLLESLASG